MRSTKPLRTTWLTQTGVCFGLYGLSLLPFAAQASSTATVTVAATYMASTCNITVPSSYWLGTLTPEVYEKKHSPLRINWTCDGDQPVMTALKATAITGELQPGNSKLEMMIGGVKNGTLLWLEDNRGSEIKLTGGMNDVFCQGNARGARSCEVIPVTQVHSTDKFGIASAIIRFQVAYP